MSEDRYDVLICEIATRKIDSVAGKRMRMEGAYNSAQRRYETVCGRINDRYFAVIVDAGDYSVGDVLPPDVEIY